MSKNRNKQRTNRRKHKPNEAIESRLRSVNEFGIQDLTPQEAVNNIIEEVTKQCEDRKQFYKGT